MSEERFSWEAFVGTYIGVVATLSLIGGCIGVVWARAVGGGLWTGVIIGAVLGGLVGLALGHVPASQATLSKRREMAATLAGLVGVPAALIALAGAAVGLLRAIL